MAAMACELTRPTKLLITLIRNNYEFMQETGWYYMNNKRRYCRHSRVNSHSLGVPITHRNAHGSLCMHSDMFVFLVHVTSL